MTREDGPKRAIHATVVKVLLHRRHDRGMRLEPYASRCVRRGDVHELVTTDHTQTAPGTVIDRVAFVGFVEIAQAGVVDRGDEVWLDGRPLGAVLGFDACHFPNHYNILVCADPAPSGADLGLQPEAAVRFTPRGDGHEEASGPWPARGEAPA